MATPKLYWDSDICITWIQNRETHPVDGPRLAVLKPIIEAAQRGEIRIVTSYLTLTEVVRINDGSVPISDEEETQIQTFFKHPYMFVRPLDRTVANEAREYCREAFKAHVTAQGRIKPPKLWPNDSIHIATAIRYGCDALHTYDEKLQKFDKKFGAPKLAIKEPFMPSLPAAAATTTSRQSSLGFGLDNDKIPEGSAAISNPVPEVQGTSAGPAPGSEVGPTAEAVSPDHSETPASQKEAKKVAGGDRTT